MNLKKQTSLACFLALLQLLVIIQLSAQNSDNYQVRLPKVLPPTPEAASLGRYGDVPVSLHTGAANVSIPLFELQGRGISVPVSLGYNSSGIKVEEVATWVGMGWSLSAGGTITRTVRGIPDEYGSSGYFNSEAFHPDGSPYMPACTGSDISDNSAYYQRILNGEADSHPDVFYYNLLGRSGKFVFNKNMTPLLNAREKLDIDHPFDSPTLSQQWRIRDEMGVTYILGAFDGVGAVEDTESNSFCSFVQSLPGNAPVSAPTSWNLLALISPGGLDTIRFSYEGYTMVYEVNGGGSISHLVQGNAIGGDTRINICQKNAITQHGVRLRKITAGSGSVEFIPDTTDRCDVWKMSAGSKGSRALTQIIVRDPKGNVIKDFRLSHGYFGSSADIASCGTTESANRLRLSLNEVSETITGQVHSFDYYVPPFDSWPSRLSSAQDHGGYYNGKSNNNLVPKIEVDGIVYNGADREPDFEYMKMGALKRIIYPTGGTTTFGYEQHDYSGTSQEIKYRKRTEFLASVYVNTFADYPDPKSLDNASFTLNVATVVSIKCAFNCTQPGGVEGCGFITLKYPDGHTQEYGSCEAAGKELYLEPGSYSLSAEILGGPAELSFRLYEVFTEKIPQEELSKVLSSGLRIKKITTDGLQGPPMVKTYQYVQSNNVNASSGVQLRGLEYHRKYLTDDGSYYGDVCGITRWGVYLEISALSNVPMYNASDYNLGYSEVTELLGENGENGKTVYVFGIGKEAENLPHKYNPDAVFTGYRNSLLTDKIVYGKNGNKIQKVSNRYRFRDPVVVLGFKVTPNSYSACIKCHNNSYKVETYPNVSEWYHLDSTITRTYDPTNEALYAQRVEKYWYDNKEHMQATRHEVSRSDGNKQVTLSLYPQDYASGTTFIDDMKAGHLVSYPIEQVNYLDKGASQQVLFGRVVRYLPGGKGLKAFESLLEPNQSLDAAAFRLSNSLAGGIQLPGSPSQFSPDSFYEERLTYDLYDKYGNLCQYTSKNDQSVSYIWGYNGQYPIAEVKNASHNSVYYTGFEEWGTADAGAKTGRKCHTGPYTFSPPAGFTPVAGSTLSYWSWSHTTGRWKYVEQTYDRGSVTCQGDRIDDLRITPPDAQMTTYTYDPLTGLSSSSDANNVITYYEYRSGRLSLIKDDKGNILKSYQYNYRQDYQP